MRSSVLALREGRGSMKGKGSRTYKSWSKKKPKPFWLGQRSLSQRGEQRSSTPRVSQGPGKTKAWNMQAQPGTRGNQGPARTGSETDPGGTEAWYTGSARGQSPTEEHLPPYQCPNSSPSVLPLFSLRTGVTSFHPQPHHNTFLLALPQILCTRFLGYAKCDANDGDQQFKCLKKKKFGCG